MTLTRQDILYYTQALDCSARGDWESAKFLLLQAIDLNAIEAKYYSLLGFAYLSLQQRILGIKQFEIAYSLNSNDPLLQPYIHLLMRDGGDNPPLMQILPPSLPVSPTLLLQHWGQGHHRIADQG